MKRAAVLFLSLSFCFALKAQHCPFDNLGILVVCVIDAETNIPIDEVSISLVDKSGSPMKDWKDEWYHLVKNPERTDPNWGDYQFKTIRYSFAEDHFILPISLSLENDELFIKVESLGNQFETKFHSLSADDFFDLHENIGNWSELRNLKESP